MRFGGKTPKQFVPLCGLPVFLHSLRAFEAADTIGRVVLVVPPEGSGSRLRPRDVSTQYGLRKLAVVVPGGERRFDSVFEGIKAAEDDCRIAVIHDAARPFVEPGIVDACVSAALRWKAAVAAVPVADTLKDVGPGGAVVRTVPREGLWQIQTPQAFDFALILEAYLRYRLRIAPVESTDDAGLVEALGAEVKIVAGSRLNFKITTADDMKLARIVAAAIKIA